MMQVVTEPMHPVLARVVHRAARRLTASQALLVSSGAAVGVMMAATVWTAVGVVVPVSAVSPWTALLAAGLVALAAAAVVTVGRRTDLLVAARILDRSLHLEERASTAIELAREVGVLSPLGARVVSDATQRLASADLRRAIPLHLPRAAWWIPGLAVVLAVWPQALSGLALPGSPAHRMQQAIRREGARLEQFAQTLQSRAQAERVPATRRAAPHLRDLGVRLQQDRVDRAGALARINELSRQLETARRQIDQRLDDMRRPPASAAMLPPDLLRREAVQQQMRQLRELTSRLPQNTTPTSKDVLDRLGTITREGEGTQSAQVRQQLQQARRQLDQGDVAGAREALTQAMRMLQGMDTMLADREGVESARQQLEHARTGITSGSQNAPSEASNGDSAPPPRGSGNERPDLQPGTESPPPKGPWQGSAPGTGHVDDKLGAPSPRLEASRTPQRVQGVQGEGDVSLSEVVGAGRPGTVRAPLQPVSTALVARVDRALERAHVPAQYRLIVHSYFARLAQLK
jgi:hypothetical protein